MYPIYQIYFNINNKIQIYLIPIEKHVYIKILLIIIITIINLPHIF